MLTDKIIREIGLTQSQALQAVDLSRSSYYYKPMPSANGFKPLNPELCLAIRQILEGAPVYGYRKVTAVLRASGWWINHKRVLRYMRELALLQPRKVKGCGFTRPVIVYPLTSNTYWEMDLSYVWCGYEQGYLFCVIDCYDRGIPGDYFGDRCRASEAVLALEQAVLSRFGGRVPMGQGLILRVDRGPQFTARRFREAALSLGVELEYAGIRCPDDKPYIESFFSKYKVEEVYRNEYRNITEAKRHWEIYRDWYENERVHQSLNLKTPKKVLEQTQKLALAN
ncbi:MAG: IS3 family transposase, partial [Methylococcales bacterium]|nr:IS3 family transposase [Methylococcales bacterium]